VNNEKILFQHLWNDEWLQMSSSLYNVEKFAHSTKKMLNHLQNVWKTFLEDVK
jgi:hypothetical protein